MSKPMTASGIKLSLKELPETIVESPAIRALLDAMAVQLEEAIRQQYLEVTIYGVTPLKAFR